MITQFILNSVSLLFGAVRIFCFQCLGMGLKTISLGIIVEVNIQLQAQQHIAFSSASCDAF